MSKLEEKTTNLLDSLNQLQKLQSFKSTGFFSRRIHRFLLWYVERRVVKQKAELEAWTGLSLLQVRDFEETE